MIAENMLIAAVPSGLYAAFVRWRHRLAAAEIVSRLGLCFGSTKWYAAGLATSVPFMAMGVAVSNWTKGFHGSMTAPFAGANPSASIIGSALLYAFVTTALPEELLFRGLIAGAIFRKLSFRTANVVQALIFTAPHLLILLVAPKIWFMMPGVFVMALALGWLRHRSGSIGPGILVHAASNLGGALAVLNWSGH
ncbi:MAG: CPBP family intramembrane glutamic endopeptidase [Elusimicrobiota bacterium]